MRKRYIYMLRITYPPDGVPVIPESWDKNEENWFYNRVNWKSMVEQHTQNDGFHWPKNRAYLTLEGAQNRVDMFTKYGAEVEIIRSEPIHWEDSVPPALSKEDLQRRDAAMSGMFRILEETAI